MPGCTVLVLGGYGFFGRRLVERLARQNSLRVIIAGRSLAKGEALAAQLRAQTKASMVCIAMDVQADDLASQIARTGAQVVVHTCGPFQGQGYEVARACLAAGSHYIDLADGRQFVAGISALDEEARRARLCLLSGASSVPALSGAAVDQLSRGMLVVRSIDIGISPGNRTDRGLATVKAILGYCGKRLPGAGAAPVFGWAGRWRHAYPAPVGLRNLSPCDVPDLELLAPRYPGVPSVRFGAGLELGLLHRGMNLMAWMVRRGLVSDWSAHARWLKQAADLLQAFGSDAGAMHVGVVGESATGERLERLWHLVATAGDGPYVPTLAAAALVRRVSEGQPPAAGARPAIGLLTLEDFIFEASGLHISMAEVR